MFVDLEELSSDATQLVAAVETSLLKGDLDQALQEAVDAKAKFKSSGNAKGEAAACRAICRVSCCSPGASKEALEAAESAVAAGKTAGEAAEAAGARQLANAYVLAKNGEDAIRPAEEAFAKFQSLSMPAGEAAALVTLAKVNLLLDRYQKALELAEKAAETFKKVSDKTGEAVALHLVIDVCAEMKKSVQAVHAADKMLEMFKSVDDPLSQGVATVLSMEAYLANDDNAEAFGLLKDATKLLKPIGATKRVARALQLGAEARAASASDEAIELAERAQVMFQQSGDKYGQAGAMITAANLYNTLGEFDKASYRAEAGAEAYRKLKADSEAAASLRTAALIFLDKKQYDPNAGKGVGKDALRTAKASKKLYEDAGSIKGAGYAGSLQTLAAAMLANEEYNSAMEAATKSKELFDALDHPVGAASALNTMAQVHHKLGDTFEAVSAAKQAEQLFKEGNDEEGAEVAAYLIETFEAATEKEEKDKDKEATEEGAEETVGKKKREPKPAAVKSVSGLGDLVPGNPAAVTFLAAYEAYEGRAATAPGARRQVSGKEGALEESFQAPTTTAAVFTLRWLPAQPKPEPEPPSKRSAKRLANKVIKMDMYTGEASAPISILPVVEAPGRKPPRDLTALD